MSGDFLTSTVPFLAVLVVSDGLSLYGAYLALSVRRGLAVPIYRSRALWTAMIALLFSLSILFGGDLSLIFPSSYLFVASFVIYFGLFTLATLAIFVWVDRTVTTLIRLDFLRRDLAGWKRFRYVYWTLVAISFVFYPFGSSLYFNSFFNIVYTVSFVIPLAYAALAVRSGAKRTPDMTFRSHLRWSAYCMAGILLAGITYFVTLDVVIVSLPYVVIAFCLYKMARSLVPVGKFETGP